MVERWVFHEDDTRNKNMDCEAGCNAKSGNTLSYVSKRTRTAEMPSFRAADLLNKLNEQAKRKASEQTIILPHEFSLNALAEIANLPARERTSLQC